ncbi:hypothetical protein SAMN05216488_2495 [Microbacterium sp. LKL04]|uniref:hypothetical protein n=1 Tax=Microbacterium sp. LKL04 TaxID=912630 RepID=UPI000875E6F8|nr:hypothetical protein [Microbacterium sp. LKL04]SCY60103.1 hypothetical protein SAMN05216488_2495 [Microbacterium sp. LKL04]
MFFTSRRALVISVVILGGLAVSVTLSACVVSTAPDPQMVTPSSLAQTQTPSPSPQQQYEEAVRSFDLALPEGYHWPVDYPPEFFTGGPRSELPYRTERLWGCIVITAAWDAAAQGDTERADLLLETLTARDVEWDIDYLTSWDSDNRPVGDSGLCLADLRGIDVGSPSETY